MAPTKRLAAAFATGALLVGALSAPAAAHKVTLDQMHISNFGSGGIQAQMWLDPENHPGTVKLTLKKKNAAGDWVNVDTAKAIYQPGYGYFHTFDPVPGKTRCKAKGVFTKKDHKTVTGVSDVIPC